MEDLSVRLCFLLLSSNTVTILWDGTWTTTQVPETCFYLTAAGNTDRNKSQIFTRANTGAAPTHVCPQLCSASAHSPCPRSGTAAHPVTACQTPPLGLVLLLFPCHTVNSVPNRWTNNTRKQTTVKRPKDGDPLSWPSLSNMTFMISLLQYSTSSTYTAHLTFMSQAYTIMSACQTKKEWFCSWRNQSTEKQSNPSKARSCWKDWILPCFFTSPSCAAPM